MGEAQLSVCQVKALGFRDLFEDLCYLLVDCKLQTLESLQHSARTSGRGNAPGLWIHTHADLCG